MKIDDKTTVPLWAVFSTIPAFIGGVMWISFIAFKTDAHADSIAEINKIQSASSAEITQFRKENYQMLLEVRKDIAVIKYKLNIKE